MTSTDPAFSAIDMEHEDGSVYRYIHTLGAFEIDGIRYFYQRGNYRRKMIETITEERDPGAGMHYKADWHPYEDCYVRHNHLLSIEFCKGACRVG
jgi:hypothetical protein